jgi:hypothetical protein
MTSTLYRPAVIDTAGYLACVMLSIVGFVIVAMSIGVQIAVQPAANRPRLARGRSIFRSFRISYNWDLAGFVLQEPLFPQFLCTAIPADHAGIFCGHNCIRYLLQPHE